MKAMMDTAKLAPLVNRNAQELVGIDLGSNNLKLVHVRFSANKREVVRIVTCNINGLSDHDLTKAISSAFHDLKINKPLLINFVPTNIVITKNIEIPSTNPEEIKDIINLQAGRHTPYSRDEIIVDYINIGTYKHSYTKILLVIVSRAAVRKNYDLLSRAGLNLDKIFFAPEGLAGSAPKILKLENADSPFSLIHIDEGLTDFTVVLHSKVIFFRSIPIGAQLLMGETENDTERFTEELRRSFEAYQSENIEANPNMLVLCGAIEGVRNLRATIGNTLNLPVQFLSDFDNILISEQASKTISQLKPLSFFNVITPLSVYEETKVNLIPEEIKLRRALEERGKELIKTGIFILTALLLICLTLISKIHFKSAYLKNLNTKYNKLDQEAKGLEKSFTKVSLIRNYLSNRGYALEVLTELHNVTPVDLALTDIRFEDQGKFSIRGIGESMSSVFSYVDALEKSKYFKDVKTKYTSKRKQGSQDVTDFEITSLLTKPVD